MTDKGFVDAYREVYRDVDRTVIEHGLRVFLSNSKIALTIFTILMLALAFLMLK